MTNAPVPRRLQARLNARLLCAAIAALLCACGPGGPKRETGDSGGGGGGPSPGITVLAGDAATAGSVDNKGASARFNLPRGVAVDTNGNVYVADQSNFAIRKITPDGTVSTFAGQRGTSGTRDANGNSARFTLPTAITIDGSGNLYVTDATAIRKITPDATVSTVITFPVGDFGGDTRLYPGGIAADGAGNLVVTSGVDTRRIPLSNPGRWTRLEQGAVEMLPGAVEMITRGVATRDDNTAYVADLQRTISRATSGATSLTRFAGTPGQVGNDDGNANTARFQQLAALAADKDGNLYAADAVSNVVRKITTSATVTTPAGTIGATTLRTGRLPGSFATLRGIAVGADGTLYAASGNAVVKIVLP